jgi:protoheme IX farnesyltransferase
MLGWVAATNQFGIEAGFLFMIQFFWQFPHFWSIGWLQFEEYKKQGFIMLPMDKKDRICNQTNYFLHSTYDIGLYFTRI